MPTLFIAVIAVVFALWLLKAFANADPKKMIKVGRTAGGILALAGAAFLGSRGQLSIAMPLGAAGLGLLGWWPHSATNWLHLGRRSSGQVSRVRSNFLEVELNHDSGAMTGTIIAGRYAGANLDQLELSVLTGLLGEFDTESRDLLAAYLDRRHPRWRENVQDELGNGAGWRGAVRQNDGGGGLQDPWPSTGSEHGGNRAGSPRAHEETASRPGGVDVSRCSRQ